MKCNFQPFVFTCINCLHQHFRCPDFPFFCFVLRKCCIYCRVLVHHFPLYGLSETAPQNLVDLMHCRCGDHFVLIHISGALYCRHFQKTCVILFHEMVIDFRQRSFTDCWKDIVIDQSNISIIGRDSPFIMSIDSDILPHKFFHPGTFRDNKGSKRLFIFNFFFSLFCFFLRCVAF